MAGLVIVEEGRNIPETVGRRNVPSESRWPPRSLIANLPSVAGGRERTLLPQILARRPILERIRARLRGQKTWPPYVQIGTLPSVVGILSGPGRTLYPRKALPVEL